MFVASKTFTHSFLGKWPKIFSETPIKFYDKFLALSKYHIMLKRLARNEGAKVQLLQILFDMWRDHPQMLVVLGKNLPLGGLFPKVISS